MCLAIPGRVVELQRGSLEFGEGTLMGKVDFGGIAKSICLDLVPEVKVGEYVIVHVGFAISKLDEEEARETLKLFAEMDLFQNHPAHDEPEKADPQ
jgi:hydrogenase expression/formation protein HypC